MIESTSIYKFENRQLCVILATILLLFGILARLWMLGNAAFGADHMDFYRHALNNRSIVDLWRNPPWLNQIPLNETFPLLFVKLGLPATPFVTRLPFALMGIAAVFFVWLFVFRRFGRLAAITVLFLAVFNPYQIYFSRTAYHYSGTLFFSTVVFYVFWQLKEKLESSVKPTYQHIALWFVLAAVFCHMHMSAWPVAGLQGLVLIWLGWKGLRKQRRDFLCFYASLFSGALLVGLLMLRWVLRGLKRLDIAASGGKPMLGSDAASEFSRLFPAYFAGENRWAILLLVLFACFLILALLAESKHRRLLRSLTTMFTLHVLVVSLYIAVAGGGKAKITYFSGVWPLFILSLGVGVWSGLGVAAKGREYIRVAGLVLFLGAYAALTIPPALAIVNLDGKALPTYKINDWITDNVPANRPLLVDNWLHPWNQLNIHNRIGVNYTFTVPDDPVQSYRQFEWPRTVVEFFRKYPSAGFVEVARGRYAGKIEPWTFPENYFSHVVSITNTSAMTLRRFEVYPSHRYSAANTNQVVTRIFYNEIDDLIEASRQDGQETLRLFGANWRFLKPWQEMPGWPEQLMQLLWLQAGMYADGGKTPESVAALQRLPQQQAMTYLNQGRWGDYRIPGSHSTLRLFNLTDKDMQATLAVTGIALSGNVRCMINDKVLLFPQTLMTTHNLPVSLKPGENEVAVAMPMNQFMLVHDVRLAPVDIDGSKRE